LDRGKELGKLKIHPKLYLEYDRRTGIFGYLGLFKMLIDNVMC